MTKRFVCQHCQTTYPDFDVAHVCSRGPHAPKLKPKINNRIKELAEQSGWGKGEIYDDCIQCSPFHPEKFAELIIREYSYDVMNLTAAPEHVAMAAKHWGVEL